jgi:integrase
MTRQQRPPQIRKIEVTDRRTGKPVVRYQVTADAGRDPETGRRRQIRRRFTTEPAARAELAKVQGGIEAGTYVATNKLTVDTACEDWLASKHGLKPSTLLGHRSKLAALRDELGHVEIQKLTKADLDKLVGRLQRGDVQGRKPWTPRSCNYLLYLTGAVLADQVKQGNVVRNVAALVDRVAGDAKRFRTLTTDEMFRILDHDTRDRHLWALAMMCGLRRGELAGLKWVNVNLTDKAIGDGDDALPPKHLRIAENRVDVGRETITGTPKSVASRRTLPMPDEVSDLLRQARKRQLEERLAFGEGYGSGEHVACDEGGQPYHGSVLWLRWSRTLDDLGIPRVRLHDARHTCGTLMGLRGVPIAVIAEWLGHTDSAFTQRTYVHSQNHALKAAASSFDRVVTTCDTEGGSHG